MKSEIRSNRPLDALADAFLYVTFAVTGTGVVLPGTLLSFFLTRWSLSDQQAGFLFFFFFVGSSCGALLSRGTLARSIARGCVCAALGAGALACASRAPAFFAMSLFGFGVGLVMTSVSLLQSRRRSATRTAELARLNMVWAIGACVSPAILLRAAVHRSLAAVLYTVAICFLLLGLAALSLPGHEDGRAQASVAPSGLRSIRSMPLALLAVVPLATGIESSVGGWLEAYTRRSGLLLTATISTVTCFWAGLLLSRFLQSQRTLATATQQMVLKVSPWWMSFALLLILVRPAGWYILAGALLLGFATGPVYPLALSLLLDFGEGGNIMFLAGGIGASALPLFTGLVSGWTKSLAAGLSVPLAGSVVMGVCAIAYRKRQSGPGHRS